MDTDMNDKQFWNYIETLEILKKAWSETEDEILAKKIKSLFAESKTYVLDLLFREIGQLQWEEQMDSDYADLHDSYGMSLGYGRLDISCDVRILEQMVRELDRANIID